jgi:hypothetical protein
VALDESPVQEDLIYIGTDDGLIQVTEDGGDTWRKRDSFPGVPDRTYVNEVLASQHDSGTVYAAFNNHKNGDFKPYVLKSTDTGRSWSPIASNLPERGSVYALAEDHVNPALLFAGTEFGIFVSIDGGGHWKQMKAGLPTIAVRDIAIQQRENDLVLATFGRSFYVLDDYTPLRHLSAEAIASQALVFPVKDPWMFLESTPLGGRGKGFQGEMYYAAPNPPVGAVITYYLNAGVKTLRQKRQEQEREAVKKGEAVPYPTYEQIKAEQEEEAAYLVLTIWDEGDRVVRRLREPARDGLHRVVWDLRYPALNPTTTSQASPTASSPPGTLVIPGPYKVRLSLFREGNEVKLSEQPPVEFTVKPLNNATLPAEDRAALVAFQMEAQELNRALNAVSSAVRELDTLATHFRVALKSVNDAEAGARIFSRVRALEKELGEIQILLNGDSILSRVDRDAEPGLLSRVRTASRDNWRSTSAPTQTQRDALAMVEEAYPAILERVRKLVEVDAGAIEKMLEDVGAPYTPGRLPVIKK